MTEQALFDRPAVDPQRHVTLGKATTGLSRGVSLLVLLAVPSRRKTMAPTLGPVRILRATVI